jgi:hypothetical protein
MLSKKSTSMLPVIQRRIHSQELPMSTVKLNWPAIAAAAVAAFIFEAIWFSVFMIPWLEGIGRSQDWFLAAANINPALHYITAFLCSIVAAVVLSILTQTTGPQTARRGVLIAALVWVGFVATSWAKEYIFEVRTLQIFLINAGYSLVGLMLMGAITGAWKAKQKSS